MPTVIYFRHSDTIPELSSGVQDNKPEPKASAQCQRDIPLPNVLYSDDNPSQTYKRISYLRNLRPAIAVKLAIRWSGMERDFLRQQRFCGTFPDLWVASQNTHSWITQLLRKRSVLHRLPAGRLAATNRKEPAKFVPSARTAMKTNWHIY
jgi:hypothetical protein